MQFIVIIHPIGTVTKLYIVYGSNSKVRNRNGLIIKSRNSPCDFFSSMVTNHENALNIRLKYG